MNLHNPESFLYHIEEATIVKGDYSQDDDPILFANEDNCLVFSVITLLGLEEDQRLALLYYLSEPLIGEFTDRGWETTREPSFVVLVVDPEAESLEEWIGKVKLVGLAFLQGWLDGYTFDEITDDLIAERCEVDIHALDESILEDAFPPIALEDASEAMLEAAQSTNCPVDFPDDIPYYITTIGKLIEIYIDLIQKNTPDDNSDTSD